MDVFLIDSWDQKKQHKQISFFGQAEQGNLFHLSKFFEEPVALTAEVVPLD